MEVLATMDANSLIDAVRRFVARRGTVETLTTDNGRNMVGGERELREAIRNWNSSAVDEQFRQQGISWKFLTSHASHHNGVVERVNGLARECLRHVIVGQTMTDETFHTIIIECEKILNGRPLTKCNDDPDQLKPLTPSDLLLLEPNAALPPGLFDRADCVLRKRWRQAQFVADEFWNRFRREYLALLRLRTKWLKPGRNLAVGDLVLVSDAQLPRGMWPIAIVEAVFPGDDGVVRSARIRTTKKAVLERPIVKLALLEAAK